MRATVEARTGQIDRKGAPGTVEVLWPYVESIEGETGSYNMEHQRIEGLQEVTVRPSGAGSHGRVSPPLSALSTLNTSTVIAAASVQNRRRDRT